MKWPLENTGKNIREIIIDRLAHDPYSQEHVDKVVLRTIEELRYEDGRRAASGQHDVREPSSHPLNLFY